MFGYDLLPDGHILFPAWHGVSCSLWLQDSYPASRLISSNTVQTFQIFSVTFVQYMYTSTCESEIHATPGLELTKFRHWSVDKTDSSFSLSGRGCIRFTSLGIYYVFANHLIHFWHSPPYQWVRAIIS